MGTVIAKPRYRVIMAGLGQTGSTTMLYRTLSNRTFDPIPTLGFNYEEIETKRAIFEIRDIGFGISAWMIYDQYVPTHGVIFCIDSTHDSLRMKASCPSLSLKDLNSRDGPDTLLGKHPNNSSEGRLVHLSKICDHKTPFVILCTKSDLRDAESPETIRAKLKPDAILGDRLLSISSVSILDEYPLRQALDSIADYHEKH